MKRNIEMYESDLNREEIDLLSSFEKDEWKSVKNVEKEKNHARKTATNTMLTVVMKKNKEEIYYEEET